MGRTEGREQPKKAKKKKQSSSEADTTDSEMDLDRKLKPIRAYVKDRPNMVRQMFRSLQGKRIKKLLPPLLKKVPLGELEQLCVEELEVMSTTRIQFVLAGRVMSSSSGTEDTSDSPGSGRGDSESLSEHWPVEQALADSTTTAQEEQKELASSSASHVSPIVSSEDDEEEEPSKEEKKAEASQVLSEMSDSDSPDEEETVCEPDSLHVEEGIIEEVLHEGKKKEPPVERSVIAIEAQSLRACLGEAELEEDPETEEEEADKKEGQREILPERQVVVLDVDEDYAGVTQDLTPEGSKRDDSDSDAASSNSVSSAEDIGPLGERTQRFLSITSDEPISPLGGTLSETPPLAQEAKPQENQGGDVSSDEDRGTPTLDERDPAFGPEPRPRDWPESDYEEGEVDSDGETVQKEKQTAEPVDEKEVGAQQEMAEEAAEPDEQQEKEEDRKSGASSPLEAEVRPEDECWFGGDIRTNNEQSSTPEPEAAQTFPAYEEEGRDPGRDFTKPRAPPGVVPLKDKGKRSDDSDFEEGEDKSEAGDPVPPGMEPSKDSKQLEKLKAKAEANRAAKTKTDSEASQPKTRVRTSIVPIKTLYKQLKAQKEAEKNRKPKIYKADPRDGPIVPKKKKKEPELPPPPPEGPSTPPPDWQLEEEARKAAEEKKPRRKSAIELTPEFLSELEKKKLDHEKEMQKKKEMLGKLIQQKELVLKRERETKEKLDKMRQLGLSGTRKRQRSQSPSSSDSSSSDEEGAPGPSYSGRQKFHRERLMSPSEYLRGAGRDSKRHRREDPPSQRHDQPVAMTKKAGRMLEAFDLRPTQGQGGAPRFQARQRGNYDLYPRRHYPPERAKYGDYGRQKCRDWTAWDDDRYQECPVEDEYEYCGPIPKMDQEVPPALSRTVLNPPEAKKKKKQKQKPEQLELYELELRARAIRALMTKQQD